MPVWRYDPILVSSLTGGAWHEENFARIAGELRGSTDEAVVSFTQFYAKTKANLAKAAAGMGSPGATPTWRRSGRCCNGWPRSRRRTAWR